MLFITYNTCILLRANIVASRDFLQGFKLLILCVFKLQIAEYTVVVTIHHHFLSGDFSLVMILTPDLNVDKYVKSEDCVFCSSPVCDQWILCSFSH